MPPANPPESLSEPRPGAGSLPERRSPGQTAAEPSSAGTTTARTGRKPPRWIVLGLLALFACWFAAMQWRQQGGARLHWEHDLSQAERLAGESDRLIFLMLQAPECPIAAALDRDLLSLRDVRERMTADYVCCRVEVRPADSIAQRFGFRHDPIMVVLEPSGQRPMWPPLEGKVQYPQLDTLLRETMKSHHRKDS